MSSEEVCPKCGHDEYKYIHGPGSRKDDYEIVAKICLNCGKEME